MHRALATSAIFLASLLISLPSSAQIVPGTYAAELGAGELVIRSAKHGKFPFKMDIVGGNFHTCRAEGNITGQRAVLDDENSRCELTFANQAKGYRVDTDGAAGCQHYCGARASLDGYFERTPVGCSAAERRQSRSNFKSLYGKKQYTAALAKLEPVITTCNKYMSIFEHGWLKNDLAITQYKLGMMDACLASLQSLADEAKKTDQQILEKYVSPAESETWLPIIQAARTNLKLCQAAKK